REVKFHQEKTVRHLVTQAIRQTLLAFHTTSRPPSGRPEKSIDPPKPVEFPQFTPLTGTALDRPPTQKTAPATVATQPRPIAIPKPIAPPQPPAPEPPQSIPVPPPPSVAGVPLLAVPLRIVGVIGRLYVVLESDKGLVLMDQHAAH